MCSWLCLVEIISSSWMALSSLYEWGRLNCPVWNSLEVHKGLWRMWVECFHACEVNVTLMLSLALGTFCLWAAERKESGSMYFILFPYKEMCGAALFRQEHFSPLSRKGKLWISIDNFCQALGLYLKNTCFVGKHAFCCLWWPPCIFILA